MSNEESTADTSRRKIVKTALYVVPGILTLHVAPAFAQSGSGPSFGASPSYYLDEH